MSLRVRRSTIVLLSAVLSTVLVCKKPLMGHPPSAPSEPMGISNGGYNTTYDFLATTTDPDTDSVAICFSWGDGVTSDWSTWVASGETVAMSHSWPSPGTYQVKAQAKDRPGSTSDWSVAHPVVIIATRAPNTPGAPTGPTATPKDSLCSFTTIATDPDGDGVSYRFDWGTGDTSAWTDWVPSGQPATMQYAFRRAGTPGVRAQARDVNEAVSAWSNPHSVTIPNSHTPVPACRAQYSNRVVAGGALSLAAVAFDADGDSVALRVSWGDGDTSDWSEFAPSGKDITMVHAWSDSGTYSVKAQAKDEDGATSDWSEGYPVLVWQSKWHCQTGLIGQSSPAVAADGTVYVVGGNSLCAIDPSGSLKWRYQTGGGISSPAVAADGTVYVGGSYDGNYFYAIDPNGSLKWRYQTYHQVNASPAIAADGTVYFGSEDSCLYAFEPNGALKWRYSTGGLVRSSPAIAADGTVYVGSTDRHLYAINPDSTLKWRFETAEAIGFASPAVAADGTVYVGSAKRLYAIDQNGNFKWSMGTANTIMSSPALAPDGTVYVGSYDHCLHAIAPNGDIKWYYDTGEPVLSSPAVVADGTVYFGSDDGCLYVIDPNGSLIRSYQTGGYVESSPAVADNGTVYFGSYDGHLYAIEGNYPLADSPWPKFRHDNKNTGRVGGGR